MLFNSWIFVALVLTTVAVYYSAGKTENLQIGVLLVSSAVFYAYSQPLLLVLLFASILINTLASYLIAVAEQPMARKSWAVSGIVANLAILACFKYAGLFAGAFPGGVSEAGGIGAFLVQLPLPIGISFYTFQGISLLADTLNRDYQPKEKADFKKHFRDTFLFISFFPQLVAGPVVKARQFMPQIGKKSWAEIDWQSVWHCLVCGYFLKMVVADNLKDQTYWIQSPFFEFRSSIDLIVMLVGFSAQIFADFAGYSLIAIGVAKLFGYTLPKNFNFPYISLSITEFWRRWHISLSSWLREYLYIPLGGNRLGSLRTYVNLLLVMFIGGLWHGAAWSFAIWGLWHGAGLAMERAAKGYFNKNHGTGELAVLNTKPRYVALPVMYLALLGRWAFVFTFVTVGWLLFELTNIAQAVQYLKSILANTSIGLNPVLLLVTALLVAPVVLYHLLYLVSIRHAARLECLKAPLHGAMIFLIIFNSGTPESFVYFQF